MVELPVSSVGEILKKEREKKGLTLDDVYNSTKISVPVLRALEQDDFESFESDTYLRGFLRNYANFLKLDTNLVMNTLERQRGKINTGKGTLWDIEEAMTEEKLRSPKIISRFVVPALILIIIILTILLAKERNKVKSLSERSSDSKVTELASSFSGRACCPGVGYGKV